MHCPFCQSSHTKVIDSRVIENGSAIRRRRECDTCVKRFTTIEKAQLLVIKRNGLTEPFSREKVMIGVRRACQGRDVTEDELKQLAQKVEEEVRSHGSFQIPAHAIGMAILDPLRELDEVAYLRFASVYRSFESAEDFEKEIRMIKRHSRKDS